MKNMMTIKSEDEDAMTRRAAAAKYVRALQHRHQRLHCSQLQDQGSRNCAILRSRIGESGEFWEKVRENESERERERERKLS